MKMPVRETWKPLKRYCCHICGRYLRGRERLTCRPCANAIRRRNP